MVHVNDPHAGSASLAFVDYGAKLDQETLEKYLASESHIDALPNHISCEIRTGDIVAELVKLANEVDILFIGHKQVGAIKEMIGTSTAEEISNRSKSTICWVPLDRVRS